MDADKKAQVARIVKFLSGCDNDDISAGIGQIYGFGSDQQIAEFEEGLAAALEALQQTPGA